MVMCFAPDCKHYSERGECKQFFRFPKDPNTRQRWIRLLRRQDREPGPHSMVCSCHFKNNDKAEGPTIFLHNVKKQFTFENPIKKRKTTTKKQFAPVQVETSADVVVDVTPEPQEEPQPEPQEEPQPEPQEEPQPEPQPGPSGLQQPVAPEKRQSVVLEAENYLLQTEIEAIRCQLAGSRIKFSFEQIQNNDELISMYTGIPNKEIFLILYNLMSRYELNYYQKWPKPHVVRSVSTKDQLLLCLMKLRLNLLFADLGVRFGISRTTATNIFITWLYGLYEVLYKGFMTTIPSRQKNKLCMPASFSSFTNCRVILDCTEIPAIHPKSMHKQKLTYSAYKHRNTVKGLIGVAPNGVITFISDLYPGSTSDKKITKHCGITANLISGDLIIADKGFLIQDIMPQGVVVNIPPFLNTPQFTKEQVIITRTIARARIHVERAIRRIKCYNILNLVPASLMPHATVVFKVCGALTNLEFPLIKEVEELYKE